MFKRILIILGLLATPTSVLAGDYEDVSFVKKRYTIEGSAKIETAGNQTLLVFSEDFKTKNGPDLKIYLSKTKLSSLSANEVDQSALRLSVLKSHKGAQQYIIPANVDLNDYESIVIQCEAYTVLWGGFEL